MMKNPVLFGWRRMLELRSWGSRHGQCQYSMLVCRCQSLQLYMQAYWPQSICQIIFVSQYGLRRQNWQWRESTKFQLLNRWWQILIIWHWHLGRDLIITSLSKLVGAGAIIGHCVLLMMILIPWLRQCSSSVILLMILRRTAWMSNCLFYPQKKCSRSCPETSVALRYVTFTLIQTRIRGFVVAKHLERRRFMFWRTRWKIQNEWHVEGWNEEAPSLCEVSSTWCGDYWRLGRIFRESWHVLWDGVWREGGVMPICSCGAGGQVKCASAQYH